MSTFTPLNPLVTALLTDKYQITMAYAYWRNGTHENHAVFDLFFRTAPFKGRTAIFAGLEEALRFVASFKFAPAEIDFVRAELPHAEDAFFAWLASLDASQVRVDAIDEGTVVLGKVPLMRIEGPLAVCQLLETTLLVLVNFATLMATNASRLCIAANGGRVVEFGLRRAQGPDGGISAARYAFVGGAWGTSNMTAARLLGIPVTGTHAHAFVTSFGADEQLKRRTMAPKDGGADVDFVALVEQCRAKLGIDGTNRGELTAFTAYALAFPDGFLALVDTYDTLRSGVLNFLVVAAALHHVGRRAIGIRLDSGDLAHLSNSARDKFREFSRLLAAPYFAEFTIVASNDLNEATILALRAQGHSIDVFGVGTQLVTCSSQPALGGVFKLVEIDGLPRIKLSEDIAKANMPGRKVAYRLRKNGVVVDRLQLTAEAAPLASQRLLCVHPFESHERSWIAPTDVERLLNVFFVGHRVQVSAADLAAAAEPSLIDLQLANNDREQALTLIGTNRPSTSAGKIVRVLPPLAHLRARALAGAGESERGDFSLRVSQQLHDQIRQVWLAEAPVNEL